MSVLAPTSTGRTLAPSSSMRCTLGRWRRMSATPMYTTHSMPSRAHTVAVATPCWPAPVSAMMRRLPMRLASSACPSALLSLCDPVWLRSSRFRYTGHPARSDSRRARYSGVGRPPKSRSSPPSSRAKPSSARAAAHASSSSASAGISVSGTNCPP